MESIVHRKEKLVLANYAAMQYVVILSYGRPNAHLKALIFFAFHHVRFAQPSALKVHPGVSGLLRPYKEI